MEPGQTGWSRWAPTVQGVFSLALVAATWPLWWGGDGGADPFPAIPWMRILVPVPFVVDRVLILSFLAASVGLLPPQNRIRFKGAVLGTYVLSLAALLLLDQHRCQPWAWLFLLQGISLWGFDDETSQRWTRRLIVSLYAWSAVSKLDVTFVSERGPWLLTGLLDGLGLDAALIAKERLARLAWFLPIGELATAAALTFRGTRSAGLVLAALMHIALLVALGPWGHDHHPGVLLWNAFFLVLNPILFWPRPAASSPQEAKPARSLVGPSFARGILVFAIAAPALEPWDWYDHWPAWAVYSDRPEIVRGWVPESAISQLAPELRSAPEPLSDSCEIRLDAWSFSTRRCPVYPQGRYRLALLRALLHGVVPTPEVRVVIESPPDRRTRKRETAKLQGLDQLDRACDRFWINTRAR